MVSDIEINRKRGNNLNREERRSLARKARKKGATAKEAKNYVAIAENLDAIKKSGTDGTSHAQEISNGDKVKLNIDRIKARKNYSRMLDGYKQFVEENADRVFTANVESKNIITMLEDRRWLFWSGDLDIVEKKEQPPEEAEVGP